MRIRNMFLIAATVLTTTPALAAQANPNAVPAALASGLRDPFNPPFTRLERAQVGLYWSITSIEVHCTGRALRRASVQQRETCREGRQNLPALRAELRAAEAAASH